MFRRALKPRRCRTPEQPPPFQLLESTPLSCSRPQKRVNSSVVMQLADTAPPAAQSMRMAGRLVHSVVRALDKVAALRSNGKPEGSVAPHQLTGKRGEEDAYFYLRRAGYVMVARNFRVPRRDRPHRLGSRHALLHRGENAHIPRGQAGGSCRRCRQTTRVTNHGQRVFASPTTHSGMAF